MGIGVGIGVGIGAGIGAAIGEGRREIRPGTGMRVDPGIGVRVSVRLALRTRKFVPKPGHKEDFLNLQRIRIFIQNRR